MSKPTPHPSSDHSTGVYCGTNRYTICLTSPLNVEIVTISRLFVRGSHWCLAEAGTGFRRWSSKSVFARCCGSEVFDSHDCAPIHDALPSCARCVDLGLADRAPGRQAVSLKATLRTGASASEERVAW